MDAALDSRWMASARRQSDRRPEPDPGRTTEPRGGRGRPQTPRRLVRRRRRVRQHPLRRWGLLSTPPARGLARAARCRVSRGPASAATKGTDPDSECAGTHKDCGGQLRWQGRLQLSRPRRGLRRRHVLRGQAVHRNMRWRGHVQDSRRRLRRLRLRRRGEGLQDVLRRAADCTGHLPVPLQKVRQQPGQRRGLRHQQRGLQVGQVRRRLLLRHELHRDLQGLQRHGQAGHLQLRLHGDALGRGLPGQRGLRARAAATERGPAATPRRSGTAATAAASPVNKPSRSATSTHNCVAKSPASCGLYTLRTPPTRLPQELRRAGRLRPRRPTAAGRPARRKRATAPPAPAGLRVHQRHLPGHREGLLRQGLRRRLRVVQAGHRGQVPVQAGQHGLRGGGQVRQRGDDELHREEPLHGSSGSYPKTTTQCTPYKCKDATSCATSCVDNTGCTTNLCDIYDKKNTCPASGGICFADSNASTGSGTQASPYPTIKQCLATTKQYMAVASGSYNESLTISSKKVQMVAAAKQASILQRRDSDGEALPAR